MFTVYIIIAGVIGFILGIAFVEAKNAFIGRIDSTLASYREAPLSCERGFLVHRQDTF